MANLLAGILNLTLGHVIMFFIGGVLIYLAIRKDYEPMLLLPIGFGAIMANVPFSAAVSDDGFLILLYKAGIVTELFPILIFIAVGAMIDFTPLLQQPVLLLLGAAAQFGIFLTMVLAALCGFELREAAAIGIIGAADGPTSIYVAARFARHYLGPISVAAYSYMALVPIIQPPVIRVLTTKTERGLHMDLPEVSVPQAAKIAFPIFTTILVGIAAPISVALIGSLMFGNLIREAGVVERLARAAQEELANLVTLLLGITIGSTMTASQFLTPETMLIIGMGLVAFIADTAAGVLFARGLNIVTKDNINPMIGACGISAFPMSARVVHKLGLEEDPRNYLLMHAAGANVAGQLASIMAGSLILALLS